MIFHDREDLLQGEGGDYEAVPCRLEQQDTEGWTVGVEGGAAIFLTFVCSVILCSSVRNRTHPRKSKTLNISTVIVKIFQLPCPSLFIERPNLEQKDALLHSRTCLSCTLKTPFLEQEEHILECSSQLSDFVWVVKAIIKYVILLFREYLAEWTVRFFHFSINT